MSDSKLVTITKRVKKEVPKIDGKVLLQKKATFKKVRPDADKHHGSLISDSFGYIYQPFVDAKDLQRSKVINVGGEV